MECRFGGIPDSLIVGAIHNDFLPWNNHGARYAAGIPNAQTTFDRRR